MPSLRNHPGFKLFIQKCFPLSFGTIDFSRKVSIGSFTNAYKWLLKLEIEECGYYDDSTDNMLFLIRCYREDDCYTINNNIIYEQEWNVPYDYEFIMNDIDKQMSKFMNQIHDINQCYHCGNYITLNTSFENKCITCGLQSMYDEITSDKNCSICLEPIGYGKYKKCKNKHLMHLFCFIKYNIQSNKDICPLRCGSIIE